jgi:DNA-binding CsgD family transcriptional regulator
MKQSAAAAYIRQLCSLGLGGKAIMPELFRALHDAIPSHLNVFFYADSNGELVDIYSEYPKFHELNVQFLSEFVGGADGLPGFAECMRTRFGVEANETVFPGTEFFRSDYYNQIFRPQGIHIPLQAAVRDRSGRALGAMLIYRAPGEPNYTPEEMRLMASFLPHIAHGMRPRPDTSDATTESEDRGLLIVQPPSHVLHVSPHARSLVHFALDRTPDTKGERGVDDGLAPVLTRLSTNLRDTFAGRPSPPPTASLKSPWGLFILRAYWLEPLRPQEDGLIGVTIERHEPLSLRLLRNMRASGLTARQRQLCLLLFDGMSIPATARRLNISQHTIVDHLKKIYLKLDVHNRDELRSKLEAGPQYA